MKGHAAKGGTLDAVPLPDIDPAHRRRLLAECEAAWFWHEDLWREYSIAYGADRFVEDLSFAVVEGGELFAVCPVLLERGSSWNPRAQQFAMGRGPIPFPAIRSGLSARHRRKVIEFFTGELDRLAAKLGVAYGSVRVFAPTHACLAGGFPQINPLLPLGFTELPYMTQVIDLRPDAELLWSALRKGHRQDVEKASQEAVVRFWDKTTITKEAFRGYQALHRKDAGRVTRSPRTFDLMRTWVEAGHAVLGEATCNDRPVAFALLITYGSGAFYASACKDPDFSHIAAQHLVQWEAIRRLKKAGYSYYEIGLQKFGNQWFDSATAKEVTISLFKRGFGGSTVPAPTAERHYDRAHGVLAFQRRLKEWFDSAPADPAQAIVPEVDPR